MTRIGMVSDPLPAVPDEAQVWAQLEALGLDVAGE
jgi:hypothetical protein